jgi:hypothetical protein
MTKIMLTLNVTFMPCIREEEIYRTRTREYEGRKIWHKIFRNGANADFIIVTVRKN